VKPALLVFFGLLLLGACRDPQSAAQQDPMRCERDPKCEKKRLKSDDCTTQCNDDSRCVERCEETRRANGPLGH
jgi:hypothetical protein